MVKYHISDNGTPGKCSAASPESCPKTQAGDSFHTENLQEALRESERRFEEAHGATSTVQRPRLGIRELNQIVKTTDDRLLIEDALSRGSDMTMRALAKNPQLTSEDLATAYDRAGEKGRAELAVHKNFPLEKLSPNEFVEAMDRQLSQGDGRRFLQSNAIGDGHVEAIQKKYQGRYGNKDLYYVGQALENRGNQITAQKQEELAEENSNFRAIASRNGNYPPEKIHAQSLDELNWGDHVGDRTRPEQLAAYGAKVLGRERDYDGWRLAQAVASHPSTPPETLAAFAKKNVELERVYANPSTPGAVKQKLLDENPKIRQVAKLSKLQEKHGDLAKAIVVPGTSHTVSKGRFGTYNETTMAVDRAKVRELGLDRSDVVEILGKGFNVGGGYDEETGTFSGAVDSSD